MANQYGFYECKRPSAPHKRDGFGFLVNSDPVDVFTPVHVLSGWITGRLGTHPLMIFALGVIWDYGTERMLKCHHPEWFPNPSQDEPMHVAADMAAYGLGAYFGRKAYLAKLGGLGGLGAALPPFEAATQEAVTKTAYWVARVKQAASRLSASSVSNDWLEAKTMLIGDGLKLEGMLPLLDRYVHGYGGWCLRQIAMEARMADRMVVDFVRLAFEAADNFVRRAG